MSVAILGGSFDPVHNGHLHLLSCLLRYTSCGTVLIVPANESNFKRDCPAVATATQRLEMLSLALKDFVKSNPKLVCGRNLVIDEFELRRGGVSYTSETVRDIRERFGPDEELYLVIGDDHLPRLGQWHDFDYLRQNVVFVVFRRLGSDLKGPEGAKCVFIDNPVYDGSASEIRRGERFEQLLPPSVAAYARKHGLYCKAD